MKLHSYLRPSTTKANKSPKKGFLVSEMFSPERIPATSPFSVRRQNVVKTKNMIDKKNQSLLNKTQTPREFEEREISALREQIINSQFSSMVTT